MASSLRIVLFLFCFLTLLMQEVSADSFRCGRKLVRVGDTVGDLVRACGDPVYKNRGKESIKVNGVRKESSVQQWYYKKSSRSLEHIVVIHRGRVAAVELGHR